MTFQWKEYKTVNYRKNHISPRFIKVHVNLFADRCTDFIELMAILKKEDIWGSGTGTAHQQPPYHLTDMLAESCQLSMKPAKKPDATMGYVRNPCPKWKTV